MSNEADLGNEKCMRLEENGVIAALETEDKYLIAWLNAEGTVIHEVKYFANRAKREAYMLNVLGIDPETDDNWGVMQVDDQGRWRRPLTGNGVVALWLQDYRRKHPRPGR